jgi:hypothetical protein
MRRASNADDANKHVARPVFVEEGSTQNVRVVMSSWPLDGQAKV